MLLLTAVISLTFVVASANKPILDHSTLSSSPDANLDEHRLANSTSNTEERNWFMTLFKPWKGLNENFGQIGKSLASDKSHTMLRDASTKFQKHKVFSPVVNVARDNPNFIVNVMQKGGDKAIEKYVRQDRRKGEH
ncbi:hypothetical protein CCR75_000870 [Bremia lactucae]|uniref:RxLR effector protein n=1 Tax=Bremia lactucae TaxID=4779 RepID=A0A976FNC4_BRELC|nr:hypothetical protein CCR75_000870 [Bremia lactucae]